MTEGKMFGEILKFGYNLASINVEGKVIYFQKFPPALNTTNSPDFGRLSRDDELSSDNHIRRETFINFIRDNNLYQANGDWKGGEWGSNNFLTSIGLYIGDYVKIEIIKQGIIPFKGGNPFNDEYDIIRDSESSAWSCNLHYERDGREEIFSGYLTDEAMGQYAIDVLFISENELEERYIKILKRGLSNPNVDNPETFMPGAGEHKEPGLDIKFKDGIIRAVKEEIGIPDETLSLCYLLNVGKFDNAKRDSRYWSYTTIQDDNIVKFGIERYSSTEVSILYIKHHSSLQPKETIQLDIIEVGKKFWVNLNDPKLQNLTWMIPEHGEYIKKSNEIIERFKELSKDEKDKNKLILN